MAERVLDLEAPPPLEGHPALLDRHVGLLDSGLRSTAPRMRGLLRQMAAYHLGWTDARVAPPTSLPASGSARHSRSGPARRSAETPGGRFPRRSRSS